MNYIDFIAEAQQMTIWIRGIIPSFSKREPNMGLIIGQHEQKTLEMTQNMLVFFSHWKSDCLGFANFKSNGWEHVIWKGEGTLSIS